MSRPSDPTKLAVWRERFERFSSSGLAVGRFCSQERVSVASFYHWRKKLVPHAARPRPAGHRGAFQPVRVVGPVPGVFIHLAGGAWIEVRAEDLDAVRAVVAEVVRADQGLAPDSLEC